MLLMRRTRAAALAALLGVALTACGGSGLPASPGPTTAAQQGSPEFSAAPRRQPEDVRTTEPTQATADFDDISSTLATLQSYRLRFNYSFEGHDAEGQLQQGQVELLEEYVRRTSERHTRWSGSGAFGNQAEPGERAFESFEVNGASYLLVSAAEGQQCVSFSNDQALPTEGPLFNPDDLLTGLSGAELVARAERVNGILTDRYAFDQENLLAGMFEKASGEVSIAQEGGYVVRYRGEATGAAPMMGTTVGSQRWEFNIEAVNQIETIELPAACIDQQPAADIPIPENATDRASYAGVISFESPDAPADVAAFYAEQLPVQGWTAREDQSFGGTQMLSFTLEGRKLSVMITAAPSGSGSSVIITEEQSQ